MIQVLSLTAFALLLARVVRAPAGTWRYILGVAVLALAASQFLPQGNAYRADVAGSARTLFWIGLGLIPVAAYAVVVARVRKRTGVDAPPVQTHPQGLVQFAADAALAADTAADLADRTEAALSSEHVSLGWRAADGALIGHIRLRFAGDLAEIELLRVEPAHRRQGVASALLRAAQGEANARGAARIGALVGDWQTPEVFGANGYATTATLPAGRGRARTWMEKSL